MKKFHKIALRIALVLLALALLILGAWMALIINANLTTHPAPKMTIYSDFNESVNIYLNGVYFGGIDARGSQIFYPSEKNIFYYTLNLLVEAKSNQGVILYSKEYIWDELASKQWRLVIP